MVAFGVIKHSQLMDNLGMEKIETNQKYQSDLNSASNSISTFIWTVFKPDEKQELPWWLKEWSVSFSSLWNESYGVDQHCWKTRKGKPGCFVSCLFSLQKLEHQTPWNNKNVTCND